MDVCMNMGLYCISIQIINEAADDDFEHIFNAFKIDNIQI